MHAEPHVGFLCALRSIDPRGKECCLGLPLVLQHLLQLFDVNCLLSLLLFTQASQSVKAPDAGGPKDAFRRNGGRDPVAACLLNAAWRPAVSGELTLRSKLEQKVADETEQKVAIEARGPSAKQAGLPPVVTQALDWSGFGMLPWQRRDFLRCSLSAGTVVAVPTPAQEAGGPAAAGLAPPLAESAARSLVRG